MLETEWMNEWKEEEERNSIEMHAKRTGEKKGKKTKTAE